MNRKFALILLSVLAVFLTNAQEVTVKGTVAGGAGHLVRLIKYADQFSHVETTAAKTIVDPNGNFELKTSLKETSYLFFALDFKKSELYLKPGGKYELKIIYDSVPKNGSVYDRTEQPLPVEITAATDSLNFFISLFNRMYDNFVYNNFNLIYKRRDKKPLTEFSEVVQKRLPLSQYPYLKKYTRYMLASLEWVSHRLSDTKLLQQYFINKPVEYKNIAYTDLFHEWMKGYFKTALHPDTEYVKIINLLIEHSDYRLFDNLIQKDTLLKKDLRFRELVEMELLDQAWHEEGMIQSHIEDMYAYLAGHSKFPEHRSIAVNYLKKLHKLAYGTPAPGFTLPDVLGNERSLDEFRGKFVLLTFMNDHCNVCRKQLEQVNKIYRRESPKLQVITILKGNKYDETLSLFGQNNYEWPLLLLGNRILLLEDYDIRTFPSYILINPDGTIALAPAPMPEENLTLYIRNMMKRFEKGN